MKPFPFEQFITNAIKEDRSNDFIEECLRYAYKLEVKNYPVLFSIQHLAMAMGVKSQFLLALIGEDKRNIFDYLTDNRATIKHYNHFFIKKKRGNYREIMAPHKDLKYIQKWLLFNILSKFPLAESCKGFRSGISIYDNASLHNNAKIILKVDLLKFYDTITEKRVYGVFAKMGYAKNLAYSLAKLCTAKHHEKYWSDFNLNDKEVLSYYLEFKPPILPQGAPSSPTLANIVATNMDKRFEGLSKKLKFSYSRYADDLTFSIKDIGTLPSLDLIRKIINEENFYINEDKITYMHRGSKQYVTGLTVTNGVHTSKKYRKKIARHIYFCRRYGVENHLIKNIDHFPNYNILKFHDWLYGHICFINSVDKEASKRLLNDFNKIIWPL
ncbi:reverse transcriptase family protein [Epilithonimonas arachidiradicis]|uniref:RNA-directed DNA polymerase n=1 Tax=Epilithonimonas arachidiradicis TaxID=1617282 RepID=A0A420D7I1_9FLAO|nr:reverse transcriptase family protein [Epilithonimonas arachidiradicis]RKE86719.1 RNA-directed DNA polymerase [Epilithonimonas arachidiradicis]GGG62482.1 RNA-directed DNA polymerase [Epilithonimonas arachidiradicis]